jgi:undecaprenyl-diphosphatase
MLQYINFLKLIFTAKILILTVINSHAQPAEVRWLDNINPNNGFNAVPKAINNSAYIVSLSVPTFLMVKGFVKKNNQLKIDGVKIVTALAVNTIITQSLKYSINRERPYEQYPNLINAYQLENGKSFPSGHTSTAFATATQLSLLYKKWYVVVPAYTWAATVGYSRLYLGEHYPTDVLAGALVGTGSAFLSNWLSKKIFHQK